MTTQTSPAKTNKTSLLIIAVSVSILLFVALVAAYRSGAVTRKSQVQYVVSGTVPSASISFKNEEGKTEKINVNLPWKKEMKVSPGTILSVLVQTSGSRSDTITCEIWLNNQIRQATTSIAEYGLATCSDLSP